MPYLTRKNPKLQLSPGLVASYDIQPGNGETEWVYSGTQHTPRTHTGKIILQVQRLLVSMASMAQMGVKGYCE